MQKTLSQKPGGSRQDGRVCIGGIIPVRYLMVMGALAVLGLTAFNVLPLATVPGMWILKSTARRHQPFCARGPVRHSADYIAGRLHGNVLGHIERGTGLYRKRYLPEIYQSRLPPKIGLCKLPRRVAGGNHRRPHWFFARDVNSLLQWIVSGLWGGYTAANILKWYWWRFNAKEFLLWNGSGHMRRAGRIRLFTGVEYLYWFPVLFLISLAGFLIGTYSAPPTDMHTLKVKFYCSVRPWGWWGAVKRTGPGRQPLFRAQQRI